MTKDQMRIEKKLQEANELRMGIAKYEHEENLNKIIPGQSRKRMSILSHRTFILDDLNPMCVKIIRNNYENRVERAREIDEFLDKKENKEEKEILETYKFKLLSSYDFQVR